MVRCQCAFLCALLALSVVNPSLARKAYRSGSHSYPSSRGGLSGSGSHSYPKSPGLSGGGGHGYPSSGGLSGSGSHSYPNSGGLSGSGTAGQGHGYPPQTNGHGHYPSNGMSGNARNPAAGGHTTVINHNYNYSPPQQIRYTPTHGGAPVSYPVYHGTPPTYVYQYKDSGSKYSSLLAGLALFNLGALAGTAFSHRSSSSYKPQPGEVCKFGIKKDNGDYEETRIDCQLITSFIFEAEAKQSGAPNNTVTTTTVTNVTVVNVTNEAPAQPAPVPEATRNYIMLPNGTLVPVNVTSPSETPANATASEGEVSKPAADASVTSSVVTTTTTNTTVVNAIDVKGPPVQVTPGMQCYVIRHSPTTNLKKTVPCALLQTYSEKSLKKNAATRNAPMCTLFAAVVVAFAMY